MHTVLLSAFSDEKNCDIYLGICIIQVVAAGANPVLITRGIEKTAKALVAELKKMSKEVIIHIFLSFTIIRIKSMIT